MFCCNEEPDTAVSMLIVLFSLRESKQSTLSCRDACSQPKCPVMTHNTGQNQACRSCKLWLWNGFTPVWEINVNGALLTVNHVNKLCSPRPHCWRVWMCSRSWWWLQRWHAGNVAHSNLFWFSLLGKLKGCCNGDKCVTTVISTSTESACCQCM